MPTRKKPALSHVGPAGRLRMVDVGAKPVTAREAVAEGHIARERGRTRRWCGAGR